MASFGFDFGAAEVEDDSAPISGDTAAPPSAREELERNERRENFMAESKIEWRRQSRGKEGL